MAAHFLFLWESQRVAPILKARDLNYSRVPALTVFFHQRAIRPGSEAETAPTGRALISACEERNHQEQEHPGMGGGRSVGGDTRKLQDLKCITLPSRGATLQANVAFLVHQATCSMKSVWEITSWSKDPWGGGWWWGGASGPFSGDQNICSADSR